MSKYNDYGQFMVAVLHEADLKCHNNRYGSLVGLFRLTGVNENLVKAEKAVYPEGHPPFL